MTRRISVFLLFLCIVCSVTTAQQAPAIPGLVGYWPMNGNADDTSGSGRNGSVSGASSVSDRNNNPSSAFYFDGSNDLISLPSDLTLNLEQGFTISSWHKVASNEKTSWSAFIGKSLSEGGKMMFHSGGNVTFYQAYINSVYYIWSSGVNLGDEVPFDEWFHLSIVVQKRSNEDKINMKVYINGVKKRENNNIVSRPDFDVFKIKTIGMVQNRYYQGMLDDIAVFDQPLSAQQVEDLRDYQPSNDTWLTSNNGLFFNGNVGIGTSSPSSKLHVVGGLRLDHEGNNDPMFTLTNSNGAAYMDMTDAGSSKIRFLAGGDSWIKDGKLGIGTDSPDSELTVKGDIHTLSVTVDMDGALVPDYVFEADYELITLDQIEAYIQNHKHLPEIPSAADMEKEGMELKEMNLKLLKKIEELTLHLIEMNKEVHALKVSNETLKLEMDQIKKE